MHSQFVFGPRPVRKDNAISQCDAVNVGSIIINAEWLTRSTPRGDLGQRRTAADGFFGGNGPIWTRSTRDPFFFPFFILFFFYMNRVYFRVSSGRHLEEARARLEL